MGRVVAVVAARVAAVVLVVAVDVAPVAVAVAVLVAVAVVVLAGEARGAALVAAIRRLGGSRCSTARALRSGPNSPSFVMPWISAASNSASAMVAGAVQAADGGAEPVSDTLGLLEEAMQLARDLGYRVREEPLGEVPGGACAVGGQRQILLNAAHPSSQRLDTLLDVLTADADVGDQPVSHLLESRLRRHRSGR